jgi:hypothetical protein
MTFAPTETQSTTEKNPVSVSWEKNGDSPARPEISGALDNPHFSQFSETS